MSHTPTEQPERVPGEQAERPQDIPRQGWFQIAKRGWAEAKTDQVPLLAAGVAFFGFLALFPALAALVGLYGLFADPATITQQLGSFLQGLPAEARTLITDQLTSLSSGGRQGLGLSVIISLLVALWSASGGVSNLITAVNAAYDEDDERNFVKKRGLALLLTLGAIIFLLLVLTLLAVVPPLVEAVFGGSPVIRFLLLAARWVVLVALVMAALAVVYRLAPDRDAPQLKWVSVGAVVATVIWLVASIGFSVYVSTFGSYAKTYGVFAGIIVLLLWLWITSYAVLLGAEINAEAEQQTAKDTTRGPEQPMGDRDAVKADSLPGDEKG
ncbi:YihY/virulence factor BrkB family protein [Desertihabitans aurantiacus]|uniref:YihY/virulence factor BrkB family protein n=1 Tax=Desertihabitans aurantiacus TaxID=2282477 RepID=UPI000DF7BF71|nr:YihY/virulence factor BrkB family protein [Desertihabitans aurantiacus]